MNDRDIVINNIDVGKSFNWGKTSKDYAKYRDIYPEEFYQYIINLGLCKDGQKCLDVGTGTGVCPEICINTEQTGLVQISLKIKLLKPRNWPKKLK